MYIFCVTNISKAGHGLSSSETTYKWQGQAKTLQFKMEEWCAIWYYNNMYEKKFVEAVVLKKFEM